MNDLLENWKPEYLETLQEEHNIDLEKDKCPGLSKRLGLKGSAKKTKWWMDRGWNEEEALLRAYNYRVKVGPTKEECIEYLADKAFKDLHPAYREELIKKYLLPENLQYGKVHVNKLIYRKCEFPESGRNTRVYWQSRGWDELEVEMAFQKHKKFNPKMSPMSIEHWLDKGYNFDQAELFANETKPTRVEHWIKQGYTVFEAEEKVSEHQAKAVRGKQ